MCMESPRVVRPVIKDTLEVHGRDTRSTWEGSGGLPEEGDT